MRKGILNKVMVVVFTLCCTTITSFVLTQEEVVDGQLKKMLALEERDKRIQFQAELDKFEKTCSEKRLLQIATGMTGLGGAAYIIEKSIENRQKFVTSNLFKGVKAIKHFGFLPISFVGRLIATYVTVKVPAQYLAKQDREAKFKELLLNDTSN